MDKIELDALALEYQRDYGTAWRNLELSDFMNDTVVNSKGGVLCLSFFEKFGDVPGQELCKLSDDTTQ